MRLIFQLLRIRNNHKRKLKLRNDLVETVLIINYNRSLIKNLKQSYYRLYKCLSDYGGK